MYTSAVGGGVRQSSLSAVYCKQCVCRGVCVCGQCFHLSSDMTLGKVLVGTNLYLVRTLDKMSVGS